MSYLHRDEPDMEEILDEEDDLDGFIADEVAGRVVPPFYIGFWAAPSNFFLAFGIPPSLTSHPQCF